MRTNENRRYMKKLKVLIFTLLILVGIPGIAQTIEKEVGLPEFTRIKLMGSPELYFEQSDEMQSIKIVGPEEELDRIETYVDGDTFVIKVNNRDIALLNSDSDVKIYVTAPFVHHFSVFGSGEIQIRNTIKSVKPISLSVSGSGNIEAADLISDKMKLDVIGVGDVKVEKAETTSLEVQVSGSGLIKLAGTTKDVIYSIIGSGKIEGLEMMAKNVNTKISGSGNIFCTAENNLGGVVKGGGIVRYQGKPNVQTKTPKSFRKAK